jgi:hypothetical protein
MIQQPIKQPQIIAQQHNRCYLNEAQNYGDWEYKATQTTQVDDTISMEYILNELGIDHPSQILEVDHQESEITIYYIDNEGLKTDYTIEFNWDQGDWGPSYDYEDITDYDDVRKEEKVFNTQELGVWK